MRGGLGEDKPSPLLCYDGLSSPSFVGRFIAFSSLKFALMDRYRGRLVNLS